MPLCNSAIISTDAPCAHGLFVMRRLVPLNGPAIAIQSTSSKLLLLSLGSAHSDCRSPFLDLSQPKFNEPTGDCAGNDIELLGFLSSGGPALRVGYIFSLYLRLGVSATGIQISGFPASCLCHSPPPGGWGSSSDATATVNKQLAPRAFGY